MLVFRFVNTGPKLPLAHARPADVEPRHCAAHAVDCLHIFAFFICGQHVPMFFLQTDALKYVLCVDLEVASKKG